MNTDHVVQDGQWRFDGEVAEVFDDMLARSIPQYDVMRQTCTDIASRYIKDGTDVLDLGCSRGEAMAPLIDRFGARCRFIGVEVSDPMLEAAKERFAGYITTGVVDLRKLDLRNEYPPVRASATLCVLTLQFTPIEHRMRIIKRIHDHLIPGGVLILVEKVLGASAMLDDIMVDLYYGMKHSNGYSKDEIQRKRLALEGVLVPVTARWNEELLRAAGFIDVDCFWRWMNFAGWMAVRAET